MDKVMDIRNFVAAAEGDAEHVLGKFLYFSLANLLVDKEELAELCDSMYSLHQRQSALRIGCLSLRYGRYPGARSGDRGRRDQHLSGLLP